MAYRRSLSARVTLLAQRFHPSLSFVLHDDDGKRQPPAEDSSQPKINNFPQGRVQNRNINNATVGFGALFQDRGCLPFSLSSRTGSSFCSYSSSIGEGSDKIEYMSDVAEIFSDKSLELAATQAPVVNEVAIAAADSAYPVAALQYLIDGVHSFTGLNWWASIALTTVLIRGATLPFLINQLKATSKLNLMRPHLEQIKQQMQDMAMDPKAVAEGQKRMNNLFKEYGVTPFTPLKGLLIQGPIFMSFYFAISNMVEKVPSFKGGGVFWFTDLTTPDSLYIFPVLAASTFLITVECNMQEGLEGNPIAGTMKNFFRILAVLTIPFTSSFPKAMFCYWVTSNMFSLVYGLALKRPQVKKLLGLPEIPMPSTTSVQQQQPAFPPFPWTKPSAQVTQEKPSTVPPERSNISSDRKISSSSVISQRIRSLEKQIKAKKKNKKK